MIVVVKMVLPILIIDAELRYSISTNIQCILDIQHDFLYIFEVFSHALLYNGTIYVLRIREIVNAILNNFYYNLANKFSRIR